MLSAGDVLEGKYRIIRLLGQGGWGHVYLAENLKVGNRWAVKEIETAREFRVNFLAEPEILKKLNHSSLPRIIDIFRSGNFLYIIEDYFEGIGLKEVIGTREMCTEENAVYWAKQLCEILIYLHSLEPNPIIYRDMKPGNIIIDKENQVRLIDFGIAREFKRGGASDTTFIGTRGYAAPEQFSVDGQSDERTDIYGLGATLYHVVTGVNPGQPPFQMVPVRQVNPALSEGLERFISRCVQADPGKRYQGAGEALEALEALESMEPGGRSGSKLKTIIGTVAGSLLGRERASLLGSERASLLGKERASLQGEQVSLQRERVSGWRERSGPGSGLIGTVVIAVGGAARGTGCTHTALAAAAFLARKGLQTALLELNENPVYQTIQEEYPEAGLLEGSFRHSGVDFYSQGPAGSNDMLIKVIRAGYHYLVLDLGVVCRTGAKGIFEKSPGFDEMVRADLTILVAGAAVWQLKDLAPYLREPAAGSWRFAFRAPEMYLFHKINKELPQTCLPIPFAPAPFRITPETEGFYCKMLEPVLPPLENKKKWSVFSK
ncbi:serine/threonine protein kinase [Phosphitispora fastidiosa]|uniref:serine/threonine protein kinase n=1 Tax=Phosphitispora fastidiosa TaxID=2837202 RepID=UPI001E4306E0|nr:serine/threonine-protein kinase [Phosphitispora fastidiosa]MBU7007203.1 serine/threonine-protein kinase [Phosphitispora fastidiosa]